MRETIATGKTVEEATEKALAELGISAEEAMVEVIDLPQRKLFRTIPAKVRVTVDEPEAAPAAPKAEPAPKQAQPAAQPKQAAPSPKAPAPEKQAPQPAPAQEKAPAPQEEPAEEPVDLAAYPKAVAAAEYLKEVAAHMGVAPLELSAVKQGETVILKVEGEGTGALIGHRGEVMESLSYLCSLVANRTGGDYLKIGLDINHYRSKREANLEALAKRIGAKVARTGRSYTLEPMNPYERRIIHSAVSKIDGVKSESTGEGAARRVVILSTDPAARSSRPQRDDRRGGQSRGGRGGRGGRNDRGDRRPSGNGGKRGEPRAPRSNVPEREFANTPRDPGAAPVAPKRSETINDVADLPLYGKIEL